MGDEDELIKERGAVGTFWISVFSEAPRPGCEALDGLVRLCIMTISVQKHTSLSRHIGGQVL